MKQFLNDNKGSLIMFGLSIAMIVVSVSVSGCQLDQFIQVDVPRGVQSATASEATVPLSDSDLLWAEWTSFVEKNTDALRARIGSANSQHAMVSSITSMGLDTATSAAGALPGGAFIVAGLTGLGGLFLKKPGTDKMIRKEKEASYNKGVKVGKETDVE